MNVDRQQPPSASEGPSGGTDPSLAELLDAARDGSEQAVGALIQRYRHYLLLIANQELEPHLKTKVGASDVVQIAIMNAQQHFAAFHGESESQLLGWLRTILLNDLRKQRRHFAAEKRNSKRELPLGDSAIAGVVADARPTPGSRALQRERIDLLFQALAKLSEDQRMAITLRNFEEFDFAEIGRRLNRSPEAARKLWARAIESLRDLLATDSIILPPEWGSPHGD